jgi:16S rRNA (guanine(527)-N(7))-methyltransferase RsmG
VKQAYLIDYINKYSDPPLLEGEIEKIALHYQVLKDWSSVFNLTGTEREEELTEALYMDTIITSRWLGCKIPEPGETHDVGSGAGFPGLFLPLFNSNIKSINLHEARRKKASFLKTAAFTMGLSNVLVKNDRVLHGSFQAGLVTSRATFPPDEWLALAVTLLSRGGHAALYLTDSSNNDIVPEDYATAEPGMQLKEVLRYTLPISGRKRAVCLFERK